MNFDQRRGVLFVGFAGVIALVVGHHGGEAGAADPERAVPLGFGLHVRGKIFQRTPPIRGFASHCEQLVRETWIPADDPRKNVEPDPIAEMPPITIRWILNKWHASRPRILHQFGASDVEERPDDFRFSIESRESARSRFAENAHEDSLDLIVEGMRGDDARSPLRVITGPPRSGASR